MSRHASLDCSCSSNVIKELQTTYGLNGFLELLQLSEHALQSGSFSEYQ